MISITALKFAKSFLQDKLAELRTASIIDIENLENFLKHRKAPASVVCSLNNIKEISSGNQSKYMLLVTNFIDEIEKHDMLSMENQSLKAALDEIRSTIGV